MTRRLSETPLVHETAQVENSKLGRWTEIAERSRVSESELGDYSYMMQDCAVWCTTIRKFSNIAASVRINATNHPTWRPTLHHFTYRASDYWDDAEHESDFFAQRRARRVTIGHDTWLGHGSTILPGVTVGDGAAVGAGAVVSKDVAPYTIVAGVPIPNGPLVVRNAIGPEMTAKLADFFTNLPKKDKACFEGVEGGDFTGYVPVKPDFYSVIVEARKAAIGG